MNDLTTLRGGEKFTVEYLDGTTEEVFVRHPAIREMDEYLARLGSMQALVEFCTNKPDKWGDRLKDDSLFALFDKVKELNDPRFDRWMERQGKAVEKLLPLLPLIRGMTASVSPVSMPLSR